MWSKPRKREREGNFANELGVDYCTTSREAKQMGENPGGYMRFVTYLAQNDKDTTIFRRD